MRCGVSHCLALLLYLLFLGTIVISTPNLSRFPQARYSLPRSNAAAGKTIVLFEVTRNAVCRTVETAGERTIP